MFKKIGFKTQGFKTTALLFALIGCFAKPLPAQEGVDPTRPMSASIMSADMANATDDTGSTTDSAEKPLRLFQILQSTQGRKALINGKLFKINDKIQQYTVSKIDAYAVSLFDNDTKKTRVLSIFNQTPQPTPPASASTLTGTQASTYPNTHTSTSRALPAIPPEAAILKALEFDQINIDSLLTPLQGSKP